MSMPQVPSVGTVKISGATEGAQALVLEGLRLTELSLFQAFVDVTSGVDTKWRQLLSGAGLRHLEIKGEGSYLATSSETLLQTQALLGAVVQCSFSLEGGRMITGSFVVTELSFRAAATDDPTYRVAFASAGEIGFA